MLKLGIIGAGVMGTNHARVARALRDANVSLIVDSDPLRGKTLANWVGADYSENVEDTVGVIDAAILAVPTDMHVPLGMQLLDFGIHLLVEKPIDSTLDGARELVNTAGRKGLTLMVGHTERYNPAVLELDEILDEVVHFGASRISPFSLRPTESVIMDLMIHDVDILLSLVRAPVATLNVTGISTQSETTDLASAVIKFENGTAATLIASRIGQTKIRQLEITQADSYVTVDLVRQDLTIHRAEYSEFVSSSGTSYRQSGMLEIPFLRNRGEPLFLELEHFVSCVTGGLEPRTSGRKTLETMKLVLALEHAVRT